MPEQLQKAINLAKKTGDRIIVFDNYKTEDAFVIMDLDSYEKMLNSQEEIRLLTEDELLDRINRDVALWRNESNGNNEVLPELENKEFSSFDSAQDKQDESLDIGDDISGANSFDLEQDDDEDLYYYEDTLDNTGENTENDVSEDNDKKNNWRIPSGVKEAADEVIEDAPF